MLMLLLEGLIERSIPFRVIVRPNLSLSMVSEANVYRKNIGLLSRRRKINECVRDCKPSVLLCFSNFPPPTRYSKIKAFTYFHRVGLIEQQDTGSNAILRRVKYGAMANYLRLLLPNTDLVICQSDEVAKQFSKRFNYSNNKIKCFPFYNATLLKRVAVENKSAKKKEQFIYVSDGSAHKNHTRLLQGWELLARRGVKVPLLLTLPENNQYKEEIAKVRNAGGSVKLLGFLPYEELLYLVAECQYAIYPSLQESLGLGLVEAAMLDVSVCAADLPYTYKAILPSVTFDPLQVSSIASGVELLISKKDISQTQVILENRLSDLIQLLGA